MQGRCFRYTYIPKGSTEMDPILGQIGGHLLVFGTELVAFFTVLVPALECEVTLWWWADGNSNGNPIVTMGKVRLDWFNAAPSNCETRTDLEALFSGSYPKPEVCHDCHLWAATIPDGEGGVLVALYNPAKFRKPGDKVKTGKLLDEAFLLPLERFAELFYDKPISGGLEPSSFMSFVTPEQ